MTTTINNQANAGKLGRFFFIRQGGFPHAPRHPGIFATLAAWVQRRRAARELGRLSDRELADIGVTRQDIPHVLQYGRR